MKCEHKYMVLDADVDRLYSDNGVWKTKIDAVLYCEKCLDVKQVSEVLGSDAD